MNSDIQIVEKPDWVSWEDIKQCLVEAHAVNRAKGINMAHYQWPVEKIREYIGTNGVMLVALDGEKVVGTAAICEKNGNAWYAKGRYAYLGFGSVLSEYSGMGIFKNLEQEREKIIHAQNYSVIIGDTHSKNKRRIKIAKLGGFQMIGYFRTSNNDHYNIVFAKWPNGCPYSKIYCRYRFYISWITAHLRAIKHGVRKYGNG